MAGFLRLCVILLMATGCRQILGFESADVTDDASVEIDTALGVDTPVDTSSEDWTSRKRITVAADRVEDPLADFPLLIRLSADADLAASARDDGFDIMFTAADGLSKLSHEIERFDGTTGDLVAWVRIPLLATTIDTEIFLYFGNPGAADQQDVPAVWNANFVGVWHLDETTGTSIADSTSNAHTGTKTGATTPNPATGIIGGGQQFAGGFDGISIGNAQDLDISSLTFETWITVENCTDDFFRRIIDFPDGFANTWTVTYPCNNALGVNPKSIVVALANATKHQTASNTLTSDVAHYLVFQTNPLALWIDGIQRNLAGSPVPIAQTNTVTVIGNREPGSDKSVIGLMDEVRISKVQRSQDFITTSFANQRPGSTMLTVGAVEAAP